MSPEDLARRLAEADRARAMLRLCTREWRALGDHVFRQRARGPEGTTAALLAAEALEKANLRHAVYGGLLLAAVDALAREIPDFDVRRRHDAFRAAR